MHKFSRLAHAAVTLLALAAPAYAQNDVCRDQNGNIDQNATQGWQQFQANASAQAMQQMVGNWYNALPAPNTNQVSHRFQTYEPNGLFTMISRVCYSDNTGCQDFPAQGFWAAQVDQSGTLTIMTIVSDTQVTNYCNIAQAVFQGPDLMQTSLGQTWQRQQ
jgi:hypothetical protein